MRALRGHPLLAYTIAAARESGVFSRVVVSTDSAAHAEIARSYGAEAPFLRPTAIAGDLSPDLDWVRHALLELKREGGLPDAFSILRPTSPFRQAATIRRAASQFLAATGADSLRAVEKVTEHPGKMWIRRGSQIVPLLPFAPGATRWQSTPYQGLPEVYVQNASLEIAWSRVVADTGSIEGNVVVPFFTEGHEGFDINGPLDWELAELLLAKGEAALPAIPKDPRRT